MSHAFLASCLALLAPFLPAQDPATPSGDAPALLDPFAQLVGRWHGEGRFRPGPGEAERTWTAAVETQWVLGGHFVQEDMEVRLGDAPPLQTRTIYGWDGARDRFVAASVHNDGRSRLSEVSWTATRKLVAVTVESDGGAPVVVQAVWEFGDGRYTYALDRAVGGEWQDVVRGTFSRVEELPAPAEETSRGGAPTGAEMARVASLVGAYTVEGERVDAAGRTLASATGQDRLRAMYGGQILAAEVSLTAGDAGLLVHRYLAWSPSDQRYRVFSFDDAGGVGITELRWDGEDALVGESLQSDGVEKLLASTRIELGTAGIRRVLTRTVRGTGEVLDEVALRYRAAEEKK